MKIVRIVLCVLFGLMFINAGLDKFFHYMPMPKMTEDMKKSFDAFHQLSWLMPLVGVIEFLGGLFFAIPKTRLFGAITIFPVMVGILLHNFTKSPEGLPIAGVLMLINLWILWEGREKIKNLFY